MKARLTRLARLEAAMNVRPPNHAALPPEVSNAIGHMIDILSDEQSDDFMGLLQHQANSLPLTAEAEQRFQAYWSILAELAAIPDLGPPEPTVKRLEERSVELQEKYRQQRTT